LAIAAKPQSNFVSNITFINKMLSDSNYFGTLKRSKPYSNLKIKQITMKFDDNNDQLLDIFINNTHSNLNNKINNKKVIVIDDSNEEIHKPWITPELIKLIKHRNLLQEKINEKKTSSSFASGGEEELLKKFKNLRNKVTKLVKKARSK
jgi:hypothetical protein